MDDKRLTLAIAGIVFGFVVFDWMRSFHTETVDRTNALVRRLEFMRRTQRDRLIAEENCEGCNDAG